MAVSWLITTNSSQSEAVNLHSSNKTVVMVGIHHFPLWSQTFPITDNFGLLVRGVPSGHLNYPLMFSSFSPVLSETSFLPCDIVLGTGVDLKRYKVKARRRWETGRHIESDAGRLRKQDLRNFKWKDVTDFYFRPLPCFPRLPARFACSFFRWCVEQPHFKPLSKLSAATVNFVHYTVFH